MKHVYFYFKKINKIEVPWDDQEYFSHNGFNKCKKSVMNNYYSTNLNEGKQKKLSLKGK